MEGGNEAKPNTDYGPRNDNVTGMKRYVEADADNDRWTNFEFRPDDIVIAAPSKSGTTWTQLLVALLVFDGSDWPDSISRISPWMETTTSPVSEIHELLGTQQHRRFIKSHTPLDGIPLVDDAKYVAVGRDPRDAAVSMLHHGDNIDRTRLSELLGKEMSRPTGSHEERLDRWIDGGSFPDWSARAVVEHYLTFWDHRHLPNVGLFHFTDYVTDLTGELHRLAVHLEIELTKNRVEQLAEEASIDRARTRADEIVPGAHLGMFTDTAGFLRSGRVGDGLETMSSEQLDRYESLVVELSDPDLIRWMHHGRLSASDE